MKQRRVIAHVLIRVHMLMHMMHIGRPEDVSLGIHVSLLSHNVTKVGHAQVRGVWSVLPRDGDSAFIATMECDRHAKFKHQERKGFSRKKEPNPSKSRMLNWHMKEKNLMR